MKLLSLLREALLVFDIQPPLAGNFRVRAPKGKNAVCQCAGLQYLGSVEHPIPRNITLDRCCKCVQVLELVSVFGLVSLVERYEQQIDEVREFVCGLWHNLVSE